MTNNIELKSMLANFLHFYLTNR